MGRMEETHTTRRMLSAKWAMWNKPGQGNVGVSLLGCWGKRGVYLELVSPTRTVLTNDAHKKYFKKSESSRQQNQQWFELAQACKRFASGTAVVSES